MKSFFKNVLACVVAIFIVGALMVGFFFTMILVSSLSGEGKIRVKDNTVLTLTSKTSIIDSPTETEQGFSFTSQPQSQVLVYDVVKAIEAAGSDDKIKGISLEADFINAGFTQLTNVREALADFKKSGKFVYAYGNNVSQGAYYLNSVAEKYYLNPMGMVDLKGLSSEVVFLKDFVDKYGVELEVIRHGQFKAAVEGYIRNSISDENKEQLTVLLGDIWNGMSSEMAASRKLSKEDFQKVTDSLYALLPEETLKQKLVDEHWQKSQYDDMLKKKLGVEEKKELNRISFSNYIQSMKENEKSKGDQVAVLYASGAIMNGKGSDQIYSENYVEHIRKLRKDDKVKAVVFRINSPGGSANASEEIVYELEQLRAKKPLIVSFGDYAASGGYYIAMAGDKIYSEPNTLTGSIGVFGVIPNFEQLAGRNGIRTDIVQTNSNAAYHSAFHGLTPQGLSTLTRSVEATYKRFVGWVMKNRKKSYSEVDALGGGRVWSGLKAKEYGLVDELGSLEDAIREAAKRGKVENYQVKAYPKAVSFYEEFLNELSSDQLQNKILEKKLGSENYRLFEFLTSPNSKPTLMTESLYRVKVD